MCPSLPQLWHLTFDFQYLSFSPPGVESDVGLSLSNFSLLSLPALGLPFDFSPSRAASAVYVVPDGFVGSAALVPR
jgi:hypothetical protein